MNTLLVAINSKYIHTNLAVHCLHAYAVQEGLGEHISIQEYTINQSLDDILAGIYEAQPNLIAFSCYLWNCDYIRRLLPMLHTLLPNTPIWLGGPEVSYNFKSYQAEFPYLAGIMCGEGEAQLVKIMHYYLEQRNDHPALLKELAQTPPVSLDYLPFPYTDLHTLSHRILYYESSRGCPFSCSYCLSGIEHNVRFRSLELVFQDLKRFLDAKVSQVKFVDRTFNCQEAHTLGIWNYLLEHDNGVTNFHFEIAADLLTDKMMATLKKFRPGAIQLEIGVQSTNSDTLTAIRRKTNIAKIAAAVSSIRSFENIHCHLDLIAGLPYEDYATFQASFEEVYAMKPHQLQLGFLKVLSGSHIASEIHPFQMQYRSYPPYEILCTKWISYGEMLQLKLVEAMVDAYYNSAQFIYTLEYCIPKFANAFTFYQKLGSYYHTHFMPGQSFRRVDRYRILSDFMEEHHFLTDELKERMTLDLYLREAIKNPPDFVCLTAEEKKSICDLRKKNNLGKTEVILPFSKAVCCRLPSIHPVSETEFLYFDYTHRDALTYNASVRLL